MKKIILFFLSSTILLSFFIIYFKGPEIFNRLPHVSKFNQKNIQSSQEIEILKELYFKANLSDIILGKEENIILSDDIILKKIKIKNGFFTALDGMRPGGYIDFHEENMFIISSRGIVSYGNRVSEGALFKQIKNNIDNFIGYEQFKKNNGFSLRDLFIYKNDIYISYNEEKEKDCWNTGILKARIDYKALNFKKFFSSKICIHSKNNLVDGDFGIWQSGGRIHGFDNYILLSIGEYGERYLAQDKRSINGKIIKINIKNGNYEIISMGHRNPQGLYFDEENNYILTTEHGPYGGDEINLIEVKKLENNYNYNFGWPIASAGEHYCRIRKDEYSKKDCDRIYKKYPLYKSHSEHGFDEPLISFSPSIGISQIMKLKQNNYVIGSMGGDRKNDKSLFFFSINDQKKLIDLKKVKLKDRVRDIEYYNNKLYLFFEDFPSIGVINLKKN